MNIDLYISSLSSGGAEHVLTTIANEFKRRSHTVSVTSLEKRPQFYSVSSGIELIKYNNTQKGKLLEVFNDFMNIGMQIHRRKETDVCISFLSRCNLIVLLCSIFSKKKIIVCDRNNPLSEHSRFVFNLSCMLYLLASGIIVQTNEIKEIYPFFLQKKIIVIENPLDTANLNKQCSDIKVVTDNTIISVGRLEPQKDFKTLILAFSKIATKYPDWKLKIFGKGYMDQELQQLIAKLGLQNQVILCGTTKKPFLEMKKAKVFVLSSKYEGFPNVLCEAMYAELPCVATECVSGPKELIKSGYNGILVPVGEIEPMRREIEKLICDKSLRESLAEKAKISTDRLMLHKISDKWIEAIELSCNF